MYNTVFFKSMFDVLLSAGRIGRQGHRQVSGKVSDTPNHRLWEGASQ